MSRRVSGVAHDRRMEEQRRVADVEALIREIQRYLSYLDALRSRTQEPTGEGGTKMNKSSLVVLAGALALVLPGAARAAPVSYNDPGGDNGAAADIGAVTVDSAADGYISAEGVGRESAAARTAWLRDRRVRHRPERRDRRADGRRVPADLRSQPPPAQVSALERHRIRRRGRRQHHDRRRRLVRGEGQAGIARRRDGFQLRGRCRFG